MTGRNFFPSLVPLVLAIAATSFCGCTVSFKNRLGDDLGTFALGPEAFTIASAASGNTSVVLTWNPSSDADSYIIRYGTASGAYTTTFSLNATSPTTVTGLTNGTQYYFMVTAVNDEGTTNASSEITATPLIELATTAGPNTLSTGICSSSAYTITSRDGSGNTVNVGANLTVTLTGGTGMTFYAAADNTCSGATINTVTIGTGTSTASFYAKTNIAQTMDVGGTAAGYSSAELSVTSSWNPTRIDLMAGQTTGVGTADGIGTNARFNIPSATVLDSANNLLYVADTYNNTIRRIDLATNAVTTISGTVGVCGTTDGSGTGQAGTNATQCKIVGMAYDGSRYLYHQSAANCRIRRTDTQSPYDTITLTTGGCSSGTPGNGTASGVRFRSPRAMVYHNNMLYISGGDHTIRRLDLTADPLTAAYVIVMAGTYMTSGSANGDGTAAQFHNPEGLATDGTYLYVADEDNVRIRRVTLAAPYTVDTLVSGLSGSLGAMAISGANLYALLSNTVITVTTAGAGLTTLAGVQGSSYETDLLGDGTAARFNVGTASSSLAVDGTYLYIPDSYNHSIKKMTLAPPYTVSAVAGLSNKSSLVTDHATGTSARFAHINGMASDDSSVFIVEGIDSNVVRKLSISTGTVSTLAGTAFTPGCADGAAGAATFTELRAIAHRAGVLYVYDAGCSGGVIRTINASTGATATLAATAGLTPNASSFALYGDTLFVGSTSYRIWSIDLANAAYPVVAVAGTGVRGNGVGAGTTTNIGTVDGMWADASYLYWYDNYYTIIRRIDYAASNTIVAMTGSGSVSPTVDGTGAGIAMSGVYKYGGVAGTATNLYFFEYNGAALRKILLGTGTSSHVISSAGTINDHYYAQREQDGALSATSASLATRTHAMVMTSHGLFVATNYGVRWIH